MGETFTVGQKVKVVNNHLMSYGRQGVLTTFDPEINHWWVDFGEREFHFAPDELISADEPQPVAEWQDISGNDHALSQADAEHQPVLVSTPPAQSDDERVRAIRERLARITTEPMFVKANYSQYFMVRGVHTGAVFADVPILSIPGKPAREQADFIAAAPADIRYLLARLDAVTAERDAAVEKLKPFATLYREATIWRNFSGDTEVFGLGGIDLTISDFSEAARCFYGLSKRESDDANAG